MSFTWNIQNQNTTEVKKTLDQIVLQSKIPDFAKINWNQNELQITIDKGGKSELCLKFEDLNGVVCIKEVKRSISFLHKPFVGRVEDMVNKFMEQLGAKKS